MMITRSHVRRAILWGGVGIGALGLLLAFLSFIGAITFSNAWRDAAAGRGAFQLKWHPNPQTHVVQVSPGTFRRAPNSAKLGFTGPGDQPWYWLPLLRRSIGGAPGQFILPWWILVLFGAFCGYWLLPTEAAPGLCRKCRFDLSSTPPLPDAPHQVRCPECGHISRAKPPASTAP